MAQWLSLHIAEKKSIAANITFPLPARFLGEISEHTLHSHRKNQVDEQGLLWRTYKVLLEFSQEKPAREIKEYLKDDADSSKRYQLAASIGAVFDSYTVYRPDIIAEWDKGGGEGWQPELWRRVSKTLFHKASLARQFQDELAAGQLAESLPRRCFLFGLGSLPPISLDLLMELGRYMELHFFHCSPCMEYWGDILTEKQIARSLRKQTAKTIRPSPQYRETGNPLLSSWGKVGQEFLQQLMAYDIDIQQHYDYADNSTLLGRVQNHIVKLIDGTVSAKQTREHFVADPSLQFHLCHSPLREVQVLYNRLLDFFSADKDLTAGDILITAPDISVYAEAIRAVFTSETPVQIPFSITDRPMSSEAATVQAFPDLLLLLSGRCTAPEVLALLEYFPVQCRFHLDSASLSRLQRWVNKTGIRWGLDSDHRRLFSSADFSANSWQAGIDRLLLGYFMGDGTDCSYDSLYPCPEAISGEADLLGSLSSFIEQIHTWQQRIREPQRGEEWAELLLQLLAAFFEQGADEYGYSRVTETILAFAEQVSEAELNEALPWKVVETHIQKHLNEMPSGHPFLSGKVSCCNMVPMRTVPFKIICLLGMQESAFPRAQQTFSFDLIQQNPRIGDRDRKNDDRYLFLESMLSARDIFYISWIGRSQRDNEVIPPSVVVSELLDYINRCFPQSDPAPGDLLQKEHPLQPFSPHNFTSIYLAESFGSEWLPAANQSRAPSFFTRPIKTRDPGPVDLDRLVRFWRNPARFFLEERLGMKLHLDKMALAETEHFALDYLELYLLKNEIICRQTRKDSDAAAWETIRQTGRLPQGEFGTIVQKNITAATQPILTVLNRVCRSPVEPLEVDLDIGKHRLTGQLSRLYDTGRITWRSGRTRSSELLELWIHHLVLQVLAPEPDVPVHSLHVNIDRIYQLGSINDAEQHLILLLDNYMEGAGRPIHFFPETSQKWARAKPEKKMQEAHKTWHGTSRAEGEKEDAAHTLLFAEETDLFNEEFVGLSNIFVTIFEHLEVTDAGA